MDGAATQRVDDDRLQNRAGTDGVISHWGTELCNIYGYVIWRDSRSSYRGLVWRIVLAAIAVGQRFRDRGHSRQPAG